MAWMDGSPWKGGSPSTPVHAPPGPSHKPRPLAARLQPAAGWLHAITTSLPQQPFVRGPPGLRCCSNLIKNIQYIHHGSQWWSRLAIMVPIRPVLACSPTNGRPGPAMAAATPLLCATTPGGFTAPGAAAHHIGTGFMPLGRAGDVALVLSVLQGTFGTFSVDQGGAALVSAAGRRGRGGGASQGQFLQHHVGLPPSPPQSPPGSLS